MSPCHPYSSCLLSSSRDVRPPPCTRRHTLLGLPPTPVDQCRPSPNGGADAGGWSGDPKDAQKYEEWVVYDAKAAFAQLDEATQARLLTRFITALQQENDADVVFGQAVNRLTNGRFSGAISAIDAAAQALIDFLSTSGAPANTLSDAVSKKEKLHALVQTHDSTGPGGSTPGGPRIRVMRYPRTDRARWG